MFVPSARAVGRTGCTAVSRQPWARGISGQLDRKELRGDSRELSSFPGVSGNVSAPGEEFGGLQSLYKTAGTFPL